MSRLIPLFCASLVSLTLVACAVPPVDNSPPQFTLARVQQTLKKGMSQDEVKAAIGSPDKLSRESSGWETWIYDKQTSEPGPTPGVVNQNVLTVTLKFKDRLLQEFSYSARAWHKP